MKKSEWWIASIVGGVLGLLAFLLWSLGLFEFTGDQADAKIIGATLALSGGLVGTVVTGVGIFLKHSIDQRNADLKEQEEKRLQIESDRNIVLRECCQSAKWDTF